jgi:hypothetical protein
LFEDGEHYAVPFDLIKDKIKLFSTFFRGVKIGGEADE